MTITLEQMHELPQESYHRKPEYEGAGWSYDLEKDAWFLAGIEYWQVRVEMWDIETGDYMAHWDMVVATEVVESL